MKSDLIDRQRAIKEIERFDGYLDEDMIHRLKIAIGRLPSAQKTGHWDDSCYMQRCSGCGGRGKKSYKYCPYCGSLNRGDTDD